MKAYPPETIRNVALVGHGGAGKTTLTEALLHISGAIGRPGRVEDAATVTDYEPEEHKRGLSISAALAPIEWEGHKINLLDCPGYADFAQEAVAALRVADLLKDPETFDIDAINTSLRSPYVALAEHNLNRRLVEVIDRLAYSSLGEDLEKTRGGLDTRPRAARRPRA